MAKVTRATFYASYEIDDPRRATQEQPEFPKSGVFLFFSLIVRADISWPGRIDMANHSRQMIMKLRLAGVLDDSDLRSLDARLWDSTFVHCVIEIDDLEYGKKLFASATSGTDRFVDIYLYDGEKVVEKLD